MSTAPEPLKDMVYLLKIPGTVPPNRVLVHNHVRRGRSEGERGFRYWIQPIAERLVLCACGWAPDISRHYRVRPSLL
jgi:hypothetical protein